MKNAEGEGVYVVRGASISVPVVERVGEGWLEDGDVGDVGDCDAGDAG